MNRKILTFTLTLFCTITLEAEVKEISTLDGQLRMQLECNRGARINTLLVNGKSCLSAEGAFTGYRTQQGSFSSVQTNAEPVLKATKNTIRVSGIRYGNVTEEWTFLSRQQQIEWIITRTYDTDTEVEETMMPCWNMAQMDTWKGGIFDNGGMVWCKYLRSTNDTYGVHTAGVTLWQETDDTALRIQGQPAEGNHLAATYLHGQDGTFVINQMATPEELKTRYMQNRCMGGRRDVFAPYQQPKGTVSITLTLQPVSYSQQYPIGQLTGIDSIAVRELMNTTGRYGVVDNGIVGGNGWTTNWKCLHEPFFSQVGLAHQALQDDSYSRNMAATLDREGRWAIAPDGRVASRWHGDDSDQMAGTYDYQTGYYEAVWGYTVDSQTGYVICAAEQFELSGDLQWLRSHKEHCEKALDWMLRRDTNGNGIPEMMNNNISEGRSSDWLDIVWAGFENGFVNAQLYEALNHWSQCEALLGDKERSSYYADCAKRLKESFNRDVKDGGFWYPEKKQYIYWRDKDGSIHGDNLVTPVNFAIIAFGLCDDPDRIATILDEIERRNEEEKLFHWPLCYDSFRREEVAAGNWPFPNYENGDIFPTWGYLGIRAYANHDRKIAMKFIHNLLAQYKRDGLSSQRYSRLTQQGQGTDILAGICTSVTALYRDIYGIRPYWNRMGLEPHLTAELDGTHFGYLLRGKRYDVTLHTDRLTLGDDQVNVHAKEAIGMSSAADRLTLYRDNREAQTMVLHSGKLKELDINIAEWTDNGLSLRFSKRHPGSLQLTGLRPNATYQWTSDGKSILLHSNDEGILTIASKIIGEMCKLAQECQLTSRRSPIAEPYGYLCGGAMTGIAVPDSPDPLVSYVWENPQATDSLQIYVMRPVKAELVEGSKQAFQGLATADKEACCISVRNKGILRLDFGIELPAWIEIDAPDLNGDVEMAVSEYNEMELLNKRTKPKRYGNTYRLELNPELYEGVRYGFICVNSVERPFTITGIRAVCQAKPANYTGRFDCDNPLINKIWYTGAYDVRANQRMDCFGAILKERGDRFSWTGDAYPAQAASLVAFSNYDEVLKNLHWTESHPNGIETYEMYWIESLVDYYMYSGDEEGFRELLPYATKRLQHAWTIFDDPKNLTYVGWDQRLGTGFDTPNCEEGKWTFRMLTIGATKHLAAALRMMGEDGQASELKKTAEEKTRQVLPQVRSGALGMHASADAINADLTDHLQELYHTDLSDREQRLSYSPFNQCFLLKAMSHAGHYDDAFACVIDQWGEQVEYGGTCFFEVFRPEWAKMTGRNGVVPITQAGFTSLAHPWGAGVVQWLSEEMLGIKPTVAGFRTFCVKPHLHGMATRVTGQTHTPHGDAKASFDLKTGKHSLTVPAGCTADWCIPKEGMKITALQLNGNNLEGYEEDEDFIYLPHLSEGQYMATTCYQGKAIVAKKEKFDYPVKIKDIDRKTHGEWFKRYGRDGYFIVCGAADGDDLQRLPDYVESVSFNMGDGRNPKDARTDKITPLDPRAVLPVSKEADARKVFGCYYSYGCCQRMPLEIKLKHPQHYQLAIYLADCDKGDRDFLMEVFDLDTMNRLSSCTRIKDLNGGVYLVYDLDRSVRIMASNLHGDNSLFNAIFFDSTTK